MDEYFVHFYGLAALLTFNIPNTYSCENHFSSSFPIFMEGCLHLFIEVPCWCQGVAPELSFRMTTDQNTRNGWTLIAPWMIARRRPSRMKFFEVLLESFGSYNTKISVEVWWWWWWWWLLSLWLDDDDDDDDDEDGDCFINHYKDPY